MAFQLADQNPAMSDMDRLMQLYWALSSTLLHRIEGAVVELGCNAGLTTVWLQQIICDFEPGRELHAFDSFEGMPDPGISDHFLLPGNSRVERSLLEMNFRRWRLPLPKIHEGWFHETLVKSCIGKIAFAYLDSDFYRSTMESLEFTYPRLSPGGVILIDDYCDLSANPRSWDRLPGVKKACDEYFHELGQEVDVLAGYGELSLAAVRKPLDD
ncbi:MAG: TylF/MycF/NovP-related O-methyltransferase [Candidatus Dormibacteria bacterium]